MADDVHELVVELRKRSARIQQIEGQIIAAKRTPDDLAAIVTRIEDNARARLRDLRSALTEQRDLREVYNTYYGNAQLGGFFQRAFNAAYDGKPTRYCYVASTGKMDCGAALGGVFHGSTSVGRDLFAEWVIRARNKPAALVEYPAPDFNNNGLYDTVFDADLGYRRIGKNTLAKLWSRTRVALNDLFGTL